MNEAMDSDLRAAWHRILLAWGIGYVAYAFSLQPPYPFADLIPGMPWAFEILMGLCALGCMTQAWLYRVVPAWTDHCLMWFIVLVGSLRSIVLLDAQAWAPAIGFIMLTATQYGMYFMIIESQKRRDRGGR